MRNDLNINMLCCALCFLFYKTARMNRNLDSVGICPFVSSFIMSTLAAPLSGTVARTKR